MIAGKSIPQAA